MSDNVNGIPTSHKFKKRLGRTGLSAKFKQADEGIDTILAVLQNAEYWRGINTPSALPPLRMVRIACISWMSANMNNRRAARGKIKDLCDAVHLRITTLIEHNFGQTSDSLATSHWKGKMSSVHDQIRLLRGGGAGRSLNEHYFVERNTGTHVPKPAGVQAQAKYNQARRAGTTNLGLEDWITYVLLPQSEEDPFNVYFDNMNTVNGMFQQQLKTQRVKYCTPTERDSYALTIRGGVVRDASGNPYHTGSKETAFSGPGWAIYVVDFDQTFYSESHIVNEFHHSSFLAGAPVQAAGEIVVDQGRVVALTNKTGHYQAGEPELKKALQILRDNGVDLGRLAVNDPFRAKDKWFTGTEALNANGVLSSLGDGTIPKPGRIQP